MRITDLYWPFCCILSLSLFTFVKNMVLTKCDCRTKTIPTIFSYQSPLIIVWEIECNEEKCHEIGNEIL